MDGCRIGDPSFYQTRVDITQVDSPLAAMHRCTTKFQMDTKIWKEMVDGIRGSLLSVSKVINLESEGSMAPRVATKYFRCVGNILSTSRVDMAVAVWAKSSMMM